MTSLTTIKGIFRKTNLSSLSGVLGNSEDQLTKVTSLEECFAELVSSATIPADLLANVPNVVNLDHLFYGASVSAIAPAFFENCASNKVTSMVGIFEDTPSLRQAGGSTTLFSSTQLALEFPNLIDISYMFDNSKLVDGCTFNANFFQNLDKVTTIMYLFRNSGIKTLPADCFSGCISLSNIRGFVAYCSKLTSIGQGTLSNYSSLNMSGNKITNAYGAYYMCNNLANAPELYDQEEFTYLNSEAGRAGSYYLSSQTDPNSGITVHSAIPAFHGSLNYPYVIPLNSFFRSRKEAELAFVGDEVVSYT
jgi:Leucine-rich repeat (LRR) protein